MISVIVCSANKDRIALVSRNISATIGIPHELIVIEDASKAGICDGYNRGAAQAQYDTFCFVHDDVEFITDNWGQRILQHFALDPSLGIVGLAGGRYKSNTLSGWYTGMKAADCSYIFQRRPDGSNRKFMAKPAGFEGESVPVRTLDGVLLCMPKKVWQQYPFNSDKLKGFHFYDMDISLRVSQTYKAAVVYNIELVHFSMGNFGNEWVHANIDFHERVRPVPLPCSTGDLSGLNKEVLVARAWLKRLRSEKISFANKLLWCRKSGVWDMKSNWYFILRFLVF
jgi:glycosyltransferase involved in cell wall biosynthesis